MTPPSRTEPAASDLAGALDRAGRAEARRTLAWFVATAIVVAVAAIVIRDVAVPSIIGAFGIAFVLWSLRLRWGVHLARRDFRRAATPPVRSHVVLLHDPNPRAVRPLLGIWDTEPEPGSPLSKPTRVFRCDDELEALESLAGNVVVHEAWVDTGHRSAAKPRWVAADGGVAVVHRRALFGRWYMRMLLRNDRPGLPRPLTIPPPAPGAIEPMDRLPLEGGLIGHVGTRLLFLALIAAVFAWIAL